MFKEANSDIACAISVNKCVKHDELLYFLLLVFNLLALLGGGHTAASGAAIVLIEVVVFDGVLHLLNDVLLGVLAGYTVATFML